MDNNTAKVVSSVALCIAGAASMWITQDAVTGATGVGWVVLGLLFIWG